jgi:hypothetical protein
MRDFKNLIPELRFVVVFIVALSTHFLFKSLPYSMNDDFMMNALYSGAFTEGKAIQETLFQHDVFVSSLIYLNNNVSNNINWFYYIHFLFIWVPIIVYLLKFVKVLSFKDFLNVEFWLVIFIGAWITRLFTFTWISSLSGILAWLWFWRVDKKTWTDWFWIITMVIISLIVRPHSFMLMALMACIIKLPDLYTFLKNQSKVNTLRTYGKCAVYPFIIILLFNQIFVKGHISSADEEKFPVSWVAEESGLRDVIIKINPIQYDVVDYNVSGRFYFDDRFQGSELGLSRQTVVHKKLVEKPLGFIISQSKRLTKKLFEIMTGTELLLILITVLILAQKENKKDIGIKIVLILTFFCLFHLFTNLDILKERVIVPPILFLILYSIINNKREAGVKFKTFIFIMIGIIIVYITSNGISSRDHRKRSEDILSYLNKDGVVKPSFLYLDGGFSFWGRTFGIRRTDINKARFSMLPGGWGMRSSTFEHILKSRGFANLDEAYKSGELAFLSNEKYLTEPWTLYFAKYYKMYEQISTPITLLGEKAYAVTLVKK